ncbi:MAG: response regulator, partial [Lachnospiraceae bacterium]|nr:response regulator [Lachnospiraceae bacterium]
MKLLIVDDEELTRMGVVSSVNWKALGIDEVLQADDGINGLEMARLHQPEIILCDVRMPRMNGITMLEQVEQFLPDTVSIFMSGYSDKEYLKAAIRLKTVNYIEKPLNPDEIHNAVLEATQLYNQKQHSRRGQELQSNQLASRLALLLTTPFTQSQAAIQNSLKDLSLNLTAESTFTCIIVKLQNAPENARLSYDRIYQQIDSFLKKYRLDCLWVEKKPQHLIYFIISNSMPSSKDLSEICSFIGECYACYSNYYITIGNTCSGVSMANQSYTTAVIHLKSSFFLP